MQDRIVDNPTPSELLLIFPEAVPVIKVKKREYEDKLQELEDQTAKNIAEIYENKYEKWVEWCWLGIEEIKYKDEEKKITKHIKRLEHFLRIDEWKRKPPSTGEITDVHINEAKNIPLADLLPGRSIDRSGFTTCPFHNEKTPSFKIYKDNRYHCFGCSKDGDAIDLTMETHSLKFLDAVRYLIKR